MPIEDGRVRRVLRHGWRILRVLAIAVIALEALYVVAVNVFLSTTLFEKVVDATPDAVDIHFKRGWSLFPSRVHARQLSIRGADSHIEWILRLDEVTFECSLRALLRKEFRVTMARGRGITFRARFKVASPAATLEHERELPVIDSLGPVAFIPSGPPYAGEWDDAQWHLWTVSIEGAVAEHVREVWIEDARFAGDAEVEGGFYLKPIRKAEVRVSTLVVRSGSVAVDSRVVADHLVANARVSLRGFDPRAATSVLHELSLSADASLELPEVGDLSLTGTAGLILSGHAMVPSLALRIEDGVLHDGSAIHASIPAAKLLLPSCAVSGAVNVTTSIERGALAGRLAIDGLHACASAEAHLLTVAFDSSELALEAPFGDLHAVVDLPEAKLVDAAHLQQLLPRASRLRFLGGSLHAAAHGEAWRREDRAVGSVSLRGKGLELGHGNLHLAGDVQARVDVERWDVGAETMSGKGELTIEQLAGGLARHDAPADFAGWRGDLQLDGVRVRLGETPSLDVDATVHARDARPILEVLLDDTLSPLVATWTEVPRLTALAHVAVRPHEVAVSDILASGGTLAVRGSVALRPDNAGGAEGAFVVKKGLLSVGIDLDPRGAHVRLFGLDGWYRGRLLEISEPRRATQAMR